MAAFFIVVKTWKRTEMSCIGKWMNDCGTSRQWTVSFPIKRS